MNNTSASVRKYRFLVKPTSVIIFVFVCTLLLPLIATFCNNIFLAINREAYNFQGDQGFIETYTFNALQGKQLLGVYSRLKFHHPGPLFFYLSLPMYTLMGKHSFALLLTANLINIAAMLLVIFAAIRYLAPALAIFVLAMSNLYVFSLSLHLLSFWNPRLNYSPFFAFVFLASFLPWRVRWRMPVLVFIGSFLVQNHLSVAPTVISILVFLSAVYMVRDIRKGELFTRKCLAMWAAVLLIILVAWSLPLYEQFTAKEGNMTKILNYFMHDAPNAGQQRLDVRVNQYQRRFANTPLYLSESIGMFLLGKRRNIRDVIEDIYFYGMFTIAIIAVVWGIRKFRIRELNSILLLLFLSLLAFFSALQITSLVRQHMLLWISAIGALFPPAIFSVFRSKTTISAVSNTRFSRRRLIGLIISCMAIVAFSFGATMKMLGPLTKKYILGRIENHSDYAEAIIRYPWGEELKDLKVTIAEPGLHRLANSVILYLLKHGVSLRVAGFNSWRYSSVANDLSEINHHVVIVSSSRVARLKKSSDFQEIFINERIGIFATDKKRVEPYLRKNDYEETDKHKLKRKKKELIKRRAIKRNRNNTKRKK